MSHLLKPLFTENITYSHIRQHTVYSACTQPQSSKSAFNSALVDAFKRLSEMLPRSIWHKCGWFSFLRFLMLSLVVSLDLSSVQIWQQLLPHLWRKPDQERMGHDCCSLCGPVWVSLFTEKLLSLKLLEYWWSSRICVLTRANTYFLLT